MRNISNIPISYYGTEQNIAAARNKAVENASGLFCVYYDDEFP
jgi:hypothetical protein